MKNNEYSILTLNLNLATNRNNHEIPRFVSDEIIVQDKDIVVLTEYNDSPNLEQFLSTTFKEYDYAYNPLIKNVNSVLMAVKKDKFKILETKTYASSYENGVPNMLRIMLKDKFDKVFSVVGLRIAIKDTSAYCMRKRLRQLHFFLNEVKDIDDVLVIGDLNSFRRKTPAMIWNIDVINGVIMQHNFNQLHTPFGQSIYQEFNAYDNQFPNDQLMSKGNIKVYEYEYDRNFTKCAPDIYTKGKNFSIYQNKVNIPIINYGSGYPDHAILKSKFSI